MAFPIFFRAMTPLRGAPSKKTVDVETAPVIAPAAVSSPSPSTSASPVVATPSSLPLTADAASTTAATAPSGSPSMSASPLRSLADRATDHAVIFISTFLFGDAAWGNGDANGDAATEASVPPPRVAMHASGDRVRRRPRGLRGVKTFTPSLPSIDEESTTIAVDEDELQRVRAARLLRFDLRMLARSGSFDDNDEEDEEDHEEEENDGNDEAVEEKKDEKDEKDENDENDALVNDAPELQEDVKQHADDELNEEDEKKEKDQEGDEDVEVENENENDVPDANEEETEACDGDEYAAVTRVCEDEDGVAGQHVVVDSRITSDADVPVQTATVVVNYAHIDLLGTLAIETNKATVAASTIQRCFRQWMEMKIERLVREWLRAATNDGNGDDDASSAAASRRSSVSDASDCSTCTTVSSSSTTSPSLLRRHRSSTTAKPRVDSNNGAKRVRQYPISATTQARRAAQAQQQAELTIQRDLDVDRIGAVKAKVQSFNGGTKRHTTPSALQLAARAIQAQNDAENAINDARLAALKPVVGSSNSGKRPQRVSRQRSTPDVNDATIKRETDALEERVRSVQPKVNSHRPRPRKQQ